MDIDRELSCLLGCHCPRLSQHDDGGRQGLRDNAGKGGKESATYEETAACSHLTGCSAVVTKYRSVLSSSKDRLWFGGDIPTWLCSALVGSVRDAAVAAFFATPGQTHSNRALCVAICYELHLSLTCSGKALGLAQLCAGYLQTVPEALLRLKSLKD